MPRIVSVWLPRWPILRFLAAQTRNPSPHDPVDPRAAVRPRRRWRPAGRASPPSTRRPRTLGLMVGEPARRCAREGRGAAGPSHRSCRRRCGAPAPCAVGDALYARGLAVGRGEWRRRILPRCRRRCASLRRRGEPACRSCAAARSLRPAGAARHRRHGGRRLGAGALSSRAVVVLPSGRKPRRSRPCRSRRCGFSPDTRTTLRRLGFKRIGALIDKPRAPFAARFEKRAAARASTRRSAAPPSRSPSSLRRRSITACAISSNRSSRRRPSSPSRAASCRTSCHGSCATASARAACGLPSTASTARRRRSTSASPCRRASVAHVARLIDLKLERMAGGRCRLRLRGAGPRRHRRRTHGADGRPSLPPSPMAHHDAERCAALLDTLRQRLGPQSVRRLEPVASHLPERAEAAASRHASAPCDGRHPAKRGRGPLFLLPRAEPTQVPALVPEGPPQRFRWRGVTHGVAHTRGAGAHRRRMVARRRSAPTARLLPGEDEARPPLLALSRRHSTARETRATLVRARVVCACTNARRQ